MTFGLEIDQNAEVDDGDIYKMVTPKLIKSAASHAEILFAISQSDETSSVVLDTVIQKQLDTTKQLRGI